MEACASYRVQGTKQQSKTTLWFTWSNTYMVCVCVCMCTKLRLKPTPRPRVLRACTIFAYKRTADVKPRRCATCASASACCHRAHPWFLVLDSLYLITLQILFLSNSLKKKLIISDLFRTRHRPESGQFMLPATKHLVAGSITADLATTATGARVLNRIC